MNTPALLLGAGLIFWGVQIGLPAAGVVVACLLEGSRLSSKRWDLSRAAFNHVSDLCAALFAVMVVYLYATRDPASAVMALFQWLPLAYLPLMAAQAVSARGEVDLGAFFLFLRRTMTEADARVAIDLSYPYLLVCILSAGAANVRTPVFYAGMFALAAWALWAARPRHAPAAVWAGLILISGGMGWAGHIALAGLQDTLERSAAGLLFRPPELTDPYWSFTAIGRVGRLKLSDRIVLRVEPRRGSRHSALLREASYDVYDRARWFARGAEFKGVAAAGDGSWLLAEGPPRHDEATITRALPGGTGVLALPLGAFRVEHLPAAALSRNRLGSVQVLEGPGLGRYGARFSPRSSLDDAPRDADLALPGEYAGLFSGLAADLGLASVPPRDALAALAGYFERDFKYSIFQDQTYAEPRPLENFLLRKKAGHCEYFATATVLLLRAAGIPARYAGGYAVSEYSRLESAYVVRDRHAHAWALVYVDGGWRDFDTTPSAWGSIEAARGSRWEPLRDLWSWAGHRVSRLRWRRTTATRGRLVWLLLPLVGFLAWRTYLQVRGAAARGRGGGSGAAAARPGSDSELYEVELALRETGYGRQPWEPFSAWARRLDAEPLGTGAARPLRRLAALHERYRFDPWGLAREEREELRSNARAWLEEHRRRAVMPIR